MMGNYHARCGVGEKPEVVTPEAYLSLFGQWAVDAMSWANEEGLFNGVGDKLLSPQTNATRDQIAAILHRFCENVAK